MQFFRTNDRDSDGKPIIYNSASEAGLIKGTWDITKFIKKKSVVMPAYGYGNEGSVLVLSPDGRKLFYFSNYNGAFQNTIVLNMMPFKINTLSGGNPVSSLFNRSLYVSPDGLNWYFTDYYPLTVRHYVGTVPWVFPSDSTVATNVIDISYITSSNWAYYGYYPSIYFKPDGLQMYVTAFTDDYCYKVFQFALATAWDVSTAVTPATKIMTLSDSDKNIAFSPDGTKCFFGRGSTGVIYAEPLGTAWDVSTALGSEPSLAVLTNSNMYGPPPSFAFAFNEAGNKMFVTDGTNLDEWHFVG